MFVLLFAVGAYFGSVFLSSYSQTAKAQQFRAQLFQEQRMLSLDVVSAQWDQLHHVLRVHVRNTGSVGFDLNSVTLYVSHIFAGRCGTDVNCSDASNDGYVQPGEYFDVNASWNSCPSVLSVSVGPGTFASYDVSCSYAWLFFDDPPTPDNGASVGAGNSVEVRIHADSSSVVRLDADWNGLDLNYQPYYTGDTSLRDLNDSGLVLAMAFNNVSAAGEEYCSSPLPPKVRDYSSYENNGTFYGSCWAYYRDINVSNPSGTELYNVQLAIDLNSDNFDFSHANPDGSDLRFYDGTTELNYWIDYWDSSSNTARVWVLIPDLPASGTTIRMYYGNPSATSESNADNVFLDVIPDVIGAWLFDDPSDLGKDYSGHGLNGSVQSGVSAASGYVGGGAFFDGTSNAYISVPDSSILDPSGDFSVVAWFRPEDLSSTYIGMVTKEYSVYSSNTGGWNFILYSGRFSTLLSDNNSSNHGDYKYVFDGSVSLDQWQFGALVYHRSSEEAQLFYNGSLSATGNALVQFTDSPFVIGRFYSTSTSYEFNGYLDEVIYFSRALSADDVNALYHGKVYFSPDHVGVAYVTGYLPGDVEYNVGAEYNLAHFVSSGRYGGALSFWADGNVTIPDSSSLNPSTGITIEAWIKTPYSGDQIFVGKDNAYLLGTSSGKIYFNYHSGGNWACWAYSNTAVDDNTWHHVAATYDSASGTVKIYVDGKLDSTTSCSGQIDSSTFPVVIGTLWSDWMFHGLVDDVSIYSYARSADEIWYDSHAGVWSDSGKTYLDFNTPALSSGTYEYYGWAKDLSDLNDYTHDASTGEEFSPSNPRVLHVG